ncbi:hypothetical protein FDZ84_35155 [Saccharopolyspora sp. ASAGF58]|nr:hypothetical protein FDZ84_35155 [Saccharopolyspora sp. ASAGF58]
MTSTHGVFLDLDVGTGDHHAAGLDPTGESPHRASSRAVARTPSPATTGRPNTTRRHSPRTVLPHWRPGHLARAGWARVLRDRRPDQRRHQPRCREDPFR